MIKVHCQYEKATIFDIKSIEIEAGQTFTLLTEGLEGTEVFSGPRDAAADLIEDGVNVTVKVKSEGVFYIVWLFNGTSKHHIEIKVLPPSEEAKGAKVDVKVIE